MQLTVLKLNVLNSGAFTNNDANKFKTIVTFDCRGVEPVDFEPKSGWIAEAEDDGTDIRFLFYTYYYFLIFSDYVNKTMYKHQ